MRPMASRRSSLAVIVSLTAQCQTRSPCKRSPLVTAASAGATVSRARFTPKEDQNGMFAGNKLSGVPIRTYGRLGKTAGGGLEFVYRPWLFLAPRTQRVTLSRNDLVHISVLPLAQ